MKKIKTQLPEGYLRLKKYASVVEDICSDIHLRGFGYEPGILFGTDDGRYSLDLPEWFLKRLYDYVNAR